MNASKTQSVPALERALTILEMLAKSKRGLAISELVRNLQLPKSTAHTILITLERRGYLHRNEQTHRYLFGLKFFSLANMVLSANELRDQAAPMLRSLMGACGLTVHLAILDQRDVVLVDKVDPPGLIKLATWIGKRMDPHCTGVGKALIAYLPESELDLLIAEHRLPRHNEETIVSVRKLKAQLTEIRRLGYALDDEEDEVGLRCIGCPVFDGAGKVVAAVSVSGTISQITAENLSALVHKVKRTASWISQHLGFYNRGANA
jgi:DNA-binding IclR family transcriptional regulator